MPHKPITTSNPFALFFRSWLEMRRLVVLDKFLSNGELHSLNSLVAECSAELKSDTEDDSKLFSKNTILNDFNTLRAVWGADIEEVKEGRNIGYRYRETGYSVFSMDYSVADMLGLQRLMQYMAPLKAYNGFEWTSELLSSIEKAYGMQTFSDKFISFELHQDVMGSDLVMPLYDAIVKGCQVKMTYKSFWWKTSKDLFVSPYYLKQYNQRWYLLARNEETGKLTLYGLDRVIEADDVSAKATTCDIVPSDYFKQIIGVTNVQDKQVETILLQVNKSYFDYIDNRPIHPSQEVIAEDDEKVTVRLYLKVNLELEKLLMAELKNVKVLEPDWLKKRMADNLKKALEAYT